MFWPAPGRGDLPESARLGEILGARVLGEFGDDPDRYQGARARKNYAGSAPITRASGRKTVVLARFVRNQRLAGSLQWQAFCALRASPGARAYYDQLRARSAGMRWIAENNMCSVLVRHHPELGPVLRPVRNAFAPGRSCPEQDHPTPADPGSWRTAGGAVSTHIYVLTRLIPAARFPERDPCRSSPRSAPASGDPMRHRSHHHRTVAGTALVLLGTGAGSAEDVPAAAKPTAPEWSL